MIQWLEQRGQTINVTQSISAVGSRSTRVRSYKFHNLKLKPEFTFTMLLQPLSGYIEVGRRTSWPWSQLAINSIQSSHWLTE